MTWPTIDVWFNDIAYEIERQQWLQFLEREIDKLVVPIAPNTGMVILRQENECNRAHYLYKNKFIGSLSHNGQWIAYTQLFPNEITKPLETRLQAMLAPYGQFKIEDRIPSWLRNGTSVPIYPNNRNSMIVSVTEKARIPFDL